jgi:CysZ protein
MAEAQESHAAAAPLRAANGFVAGLLYPFRSLGLLNRNRQLWGFVLIPIGLNIVVGLLLYAVLFWAGLQWINGIVSGLPDWLAVVGWLLQALLLIGLLVGIGWLLVRFGVVVGSPWYGQLSEKLETQLTGSAPPAAPLTLAGISYDLSRALGFELKKLLLTLSIGLPLLLFNFVPGAGQVVVTVGTVLLGMLVTCLDFFDSPLERRRLRFRQKLGAVRRSFPASLGFGLVCFGLVSVPFLNLLAIPLCVTAGTLFFCERLREAERPETGNRRPETESGVPPSV